MSNDLRLRVGGPAPAARSALCLAVAAAAALASGAVLLARTVELGREVVVLLDADGGAGHALAVTRVEDLVGAAAVLVGLAVAGWLAVGLTTATACAALRLLGHRWRLGERVVARTAPAVVRRAVALSAGTGFALAAAGLPASAEVAPPPVDLGWAPTVSAPAWPASPTADPPGPALGPPVDVDGADRVEAAPPSGSAERAMTGEGSDTDGGPGAATVAGPPGAPSSLSPPGSPDGQAAGAPAAVAAGAAVPGVAAGGSPQHGEPAEAGGTLTSARTDAVAAPSTSPAGAGPAGAVAPAAPVHAGPSTGPGAPSVVDRGAASPAGEAPAAHAAATPSAEAEGHGSATPAVVTVRPGDTLWGIASDFLPADAGAREVARAWPRWYAANRDLIGPDPGLIRPGQRLVSPAAEAGTPGASEVGAGS